MKTLTIGAAVVCLILGLVGPANTDDDFSGQFLDPLVWQEPDRSRYIDEDEELLISGVRSARQGDRNRNKCDFPSLASIYGIRSKVRMSVDTDVVQSRI
jgi:hypothetical protein